MQLSRRRLPAWRLVTVFAVGVCTAPAISQQTAPASAGSQKAPAGLIVGRVIEAGTNRPVPRAMVSLYRAPDRRAVMADPEGRFLFSQLPSGSYSLSAFLEGYVLAGYGKHWPSATAHMIGALGRPLELGDDEVVRDVTLRMWRRAEISGRVTDERGDPVVGVKVIGLTASASAGRRMFSFDTGECGGGACLYATTDDRGAYRLAVIPGQYVLAIPAVSTTVLQSWQASELSGARQPPSKWTSTITTLAWVGGGYGAGSSGMLVGDSRFAVSVGTAAAPSVASLTDDGQLFVYETQFHRGVRRMADAAVVTVASGEERPNTDFVLHPVRATRISGVLTGPDGPAGGVTLRLIPAGQDALLREADVALTMSDTDGAFSFLAIPPGSYLIRVWNRPSQGRNFALIRNPDAVPPASPAMQWAGTPISVGDTGVEGVPVMLRNGVRVSGRVEWSGTAPRPSRAPAIDIGRADGHDDGSLPFAVVDKDGRFETEGHVPGRYFIIAYPPPGWTLESAMWNGRDVSDAPLDLDADDVTGVVLRFTDRPPASVSGIVTGASGAPDPTAVVIAFPADRTRWVDFGEMPRRLQVGSTDRNGRYVLAGLPTGEYLFAAVPGDTPLHWRDASVLAELAPRAARLRVGITGQETLNLVTRR
jgi:hypothetical protein